jgi:hypothetical protein
MTEPFVMVLKSVLRSTRLSSHAKLLLALLADYQNRETGQCNPKIETLADDLGLSTPTVKRALAELRQAGLVRVVKGQRANSYGLEPRSHRRKFLRDQVDPAEIGSAGSPASGAPDHRRTAEASVSLLTEPDLMNQKTTLSSRAATAAAQNFFNQKNGNLAHTLTAELLAAHPQPGQPNRAGKIVAEILSASREPEKTADEIRASHAAFRKFWDAGHATFVPQLWRWFTDGDFRHPPAERKEPGSQRRRSRREELIDNA